MRFWIRFASACIAAAALIALLAWAFVPRWAPEWTIAHAPWVDPVVRAYAILTPIEAEPPARYLPRARNDPSLWASCSPRAFSSDYEDLLADWGPSAIPRLAALSGSRDAGIRRAVVRALGAIKRREALAPIERALADGDPWVRLEAKDALDHLDWPDVDAETALAARLAMIATLAADPDAEVRSFTIPDEIPVAGWARFRPLAREPATRATAMHVLQRVLGGEYDRPAACPLDARLTFDVVELVAARAPEHEEYETMATEYARQLWARIDWSPAACLRALDREPPPPGFGWLPDLYRRLLAARLDVDLDEADIERAVAEIARRSPVAVRLDPCVIASAPPPVTVHRHGALLVEVLRELREQLGTTSVIDGGAIVVTNGDAAFLALRLGGDAP
jgi:hypothetical protein